VIFNNIIFKLMDLKKLTSYLFVSSSLFTRLIPHPPGMTSVNSSIIYGNTVNLHWVNLIIPFLFIILGDVLIHFIYYNTPIFSLNSIFTYTSYLLITLLTVILRQKSSIYKTCFMVIISSFAFYVITNFGVYLISGGNLIQVYIDGLPFYGWEFLGNVAYSTLFFTIHNLFLKNPNTLVENKENENSADINEDSQSVSITNDVESKLVCETNKIDNDKEIVI